MRTRVERKPRLTLNDSSGRSHQLMVNRDIEQEAHRTLSHRVIRMGNTRMWRWGVI